MLKQLVNVQARTLHVLALYQAPARETLKWDPHASNGRLCRRFGWADGPESGSALLLIDDRSSRSELEVEHVFRSRGRSLKMKVVSHLAGLIFGELVRTLRLPLLSSLCFPSN